MRRPILCRFVPVGALISVAAKSAGEWFDFFVSSYRKGRIVSTSFWYTIKRVVSSKACLGSNCFCLVAHNNSSHSHQQAGAGTPLRGARALNVKCN